MLSLAVTPTAAQSLLLSGGGRAVPDAMAWFVDRVPGGRVVVLDYTDDTAVSSVNALRSAGADVTYLPVTSTQAANASATLETVRSAGGVFLPGGNQSRYIDLWRGTHLVDAVREVYASGGAVGGTSAGAMVLGEVVFDASRGSITSRQALHAPAHASLSLTTDFLRLADGVLFDTHVFERGRLGRLLGLIARHRADTGEWITGIGIDDGTAIGIDSNGIAEVFGEGTVVVMAPDASVNVTVADGQPLATSAIPVAQFTEGFRFDVSTATLIGSPPAASAFSAGDVTVSGEVWVDGSSAPDDWLSDRGSVRHLLSQTTGGVAILAPAGDPEAETVADAIRAAGRFAAVVAFDPADPDASVASASAADVSIVLGLPDAAGVALRSGTLAGDAFHATAALFLGPASRLAGSMVVTGIDDREDAAFRGLLGVTEGTGRIDGAVVVPGAWGADGQYWENQTAGLAWGLAQSSAGLGLLIPEMGWVHLRDQTMTASGTMPVLALDTRQTTIVGFPDERANATLDNAALQALPIGVPVPLGLGTHRGVRPPSRDQLFVYPNPSAGNVTLTVSLDRAEHVQVEVVDLQGRRVFTQAWGPLSAGDHGLSLAWPPRTPAGVYVASVRVGDRVETRRLTRVR
ncbi:MAG: Type 1 glutamine amidotransferase-like domain-containing protein [Bacteroidota bacterium]